MSFFSTRGGSCVTASQAILRGLAPDGGLYVPAMFPLVSLKKIADLGQMPYAQRAMKILKLYLYGGRLRFVLLSSFLAALWRNQFSAANL